MGLAAAAKLGREIKDLAAEAVDITQRVLTLIRTQAEQVELLAKQAATIAELQDAIRTLKDREAVLLAVAGQTATQAAASTVSDLSRRIGVIEGRKGQPVRNQ